MHSDRCEFLLDNLDLISATGVEDARWEHFQIAHLDDDGTFRIENKSRQIAWSFLAAMEAVANAVLYGTSSMFQSMNLDEAKEKILYAERVYENLRVTNLPRITGQNKLEMTFSNGARLVSSPGTPQRGKSRFWVYLDEWAHQAHDRANYIAALPIISKGGVLRGGSSPLGASGIFWEIFTQSMRPYPGYTRSNTPWWGTHAFCTNVGVARLLAAHMLTPERVERFGNDRIKSIYANMPEEDFQQEYECMFVDESTAWITWEEIKAAQDPALLWYHVTARGTLTPEINEAIEAMLVAVRKGEIERTFAAGVDIGRTRNTTEIFLVGESTTKTYPLRMAISLDNIGFDDQRETIYQILGRLPVTKMLIDRNGLGMNLAENVRSKFPGKADGVDFTNATKKLWATDVKTMIQQNRTPLPTDRDLAYQIHSIKKLVTPSKNVAFDTDRNEKHHADMFWAWALALAAANEPKTAGTWGTRRQ